MNMRSSPNSLPESHSCTAVNHLLLSWGKSNRFGLIEWNRKNETSWKWFESSYKEKSTIMKGDFWQDAGKGLSIASELELIPEITWSFSKPPSWLVQALISELKRSSESTLDASNSFCRDFCQVRLYSCVLI